MSIPKKANVVNKIQAALSDMDLDLDIVKKIFMKHRGNKDRLLTFLDELTQEAIANNKPSAEAEIQKLSGKARELISQSLENGNALGLDDAIYLIRVHLIRRFL